MSVVLSNLTRTFNAAAVLDALSVSVTDTLSDAGSRLLRLRVDSVEKFTVRKDSRIRYGPDASNHWTHLVNSVGDLAMTGVGSTGGAFSVTPAAGKNFNVVLSGAGDFAVNTNQLYVDTSTGRVGINVSNPLDPFHLDAGVRISRTGNDPYLLFYKDGNAVGQIRGDVDGVSIANAPGSTDHMRVIQATGNVAIGHSNPSAKLHSLSTTEQFRSGYDASNYWSAITGSAGLTTFDAAGASAGFKFSKAVKLTQTVTTEALTADRSVTIVINGTTYKLLAKLV